MVALLMFAAGFGLGLFFGWLLHRERVERAVYEDVVRARDRATATLAETSARLELANKDVVRLRAQLSDAQYQLSERDDVIAELEDSAVAAARVTSDLDLFDDEDDADITEEVPLAAAAGRHAAADDLVDDADADADAVRGSERTPAAEEPAAAVPAAVEEAAADEEPAAADTAAVEEVAAVEEAPATAEPMVEGADIEAVVVEGDVGPGTDAVVGERAPEQEHPAGGVIDDGGADEEAAGTAPGIPTQGAVPTDEEAAAEPVGAAAGERAAPATPQDDTQADAASPGEEAVDDLQRITGVGPKVEQRLHAEGITTFRDLALLDDEAVADLASRDPRLVSRLKRGGWVAQARRLHVESHRSPP